MTVAELRKALEQFQSWAEVDDMQVLVHDGEEITAVRRVNMDPEGRIILELT